MSRIHLRTVLLAFLLLSPAGAEGQSIFDWPLRSAPQPEAILTGAGAVFWNPGSLAQAVGTSQEIWLLHVDGPDPTGVRGLAASGVMDLPWDLRGGIAYSHLGLQDIPRTTTSPHAGAGEISVAEDVGVLSVARTLSGQTGIGGGIRFRRAVVDTDSRSQVEGELGIHHRSNLPLSPRVGLVIRGLGGEVNTLAGLELSLPPLASSRIPVRLGYGIQETGGFDTVDHRVSVRASWMDQIHLGAGFSHLERGGGWTSMWMLGADIGRYSLSVLRESLANGFGAVHFFQASLRFP